MNPTFLTGMACGFYLTVLVGALLWEAMPTLSRRLWVRRQRAAAAQRPLAAPAPPTLLDAMRDAGLPAPKPKERAPSAHWFPLPGNRVLELGLSGYSIELVARPREQHYRLIDPEGDTIARTSNLDSLKAYAEHLAAQREEFVYRPPGGAGDRH